MIRYFIGSFFLIFLLVFFARYGAVEERKAGNSIRSIKLPVIEIEIEDGVGKEKVTAYCNICHSLDYITMQPRFSKKRWEAIVAKMVKVYGLQLDDREAKVIIDYLTKHYGSDE